MSNLEGLPEEIRNATTREAVSLQKHRQRFGQ
jgi:hypothetical protein